METLAVLLAAGALIWAYHNKSAAERLEARQLRLQKEFARLSQQLATLAATQKGPAAGTATKETITVPSPSISQGPPPVVAPATIRQSTSSPDVHPERTALAPADAPASSAGQPQRPPPATVRVPKPAFDWEALVGVKLFSWIAGIALVLAAIFFLKYSVDHGWLSPPIRMAIGLLTGSAVLVLCEWRVARRYAITANALDAAGVAILFSTFFAAHALWNLLGTVPTFALMVMVTVLAALLSIRHDSLFVALLGLIGGFATPALVSTGQDRPISLFSYLLLLNAGLAWVAYRKRWPHLTLVSALFTTLYQWGWLLKFLRPESIPLALGIFLIFPILSVVGLALGEKTRAVGERDSLFEQTAVTSVALPLFFACYMAAIPAYGSRYWLLFGFLFLVDAGLLAIAEKRGPEILHLVGALGTVVTFLIWLQVSYTSAAWPAILGIAAFFVLFHLGASYRVRLKVSGGREALVAPLLLSAFPILAAIEPAAATPGALFSVLLILMAAVAIYAVARGEAIVHFVAAFVALTAAAVWSVKHLDEARLIPALSIYAAFGLFYLGVPLAAHRYKREETADAVLMGPAWFLSLAGHALLLFVVVEPSLAVPPWPMLGVLAVMNISIGSAALSTHRTAVHVAALAATQVLLIIWEISAQTAPWPMVAIYFAVATAAWGLGWFVLGRRLSMSVEGPAGSFWGTASAVASFLGIAVVMVAEALPGAPGVVLVAGASAVLLFFILALDNLAGWRLLAPVAVFAGGGLVWIWSQARFTAAAWGDELLFAALIYALFLAYPLWVGSAVKQSIGPYLAAVMASVPFFIFARHSLLAGGFADRIGLLPVVQAALMSGLLWRLLKLEPPGERTLGRLALVAGAALAFITVAIPLQLEKQWITIGWALQAAALAWLCRKIEHSGLLIWTGGLLAVVFARLVLNPAVLTYHPRSEIPILNWYLYTYLVSAAAFLVVAWLLRDRRGLAGNTPRITSLAAAGGAILLFLLLNIEIADFFSTGPTLTFNFGAGLAQDLTYTIGWGLFAFALLIAGIVLASKSARIAAILLLSLTVGKCFLHDLWNLGGLYRIGSFVGLAICLTLVALLLQRFVLRPQPETK